MGKELTFLDPQTLKRRCKAIVIKFGGTSVETPEKIAHCASMVKKEVKSGRNVVVVVSALAGDTDRLSKIAEKLQVSRDSSDEIVSMGERISMRMMCAALNGCGVKSTFIDPLQEEWPVLTDSNHGTADIMVRETRKKVQKVIMPLLEEGITPVIGGFIGKSREGKVTTLGRGGSDITGVLLGYCLGADVLIVTDVDGVFSADPCACKNAQPIKEVTVEELWDLGINGAKVMHPKSLMYKTRDMRLKIVSNKLLDEQGTDIVGFLNSDVKITCDNKEKTLVTVVGEGLSQTPGLLAKVTDALRDMCVYSIVVNPSSITCVIDSERGEDAVQSLHYVVLKTPQLKAVTSRKGMASIEITMRRFPQKKRILKKVGKILKDANAGDMHVITWSGGATILVEWKTRNLIQSLLEKGLKSKKQEGYHVKDI